MEQGLQPSPAVPAALPDLPEGIAEPFPRLQSEEIAAEETPTPSPRAEAAANQPEDDMWAADADEEAEEADGEAAQATEEAAVQPDAEAARAAHEAAAAAAAALEEEESFLLPCERVCILSRTSTGIDVSLDIQCLSMEAGYTFSALMTLDGLTSCVKKTCTENGTRSRYRRPLCCQSDTIHTLCDSIHLTNALSGRKVTCISPCSLHIGSGCEEDSCMFAGVTLDTAYRVRV